MKVRSYKVVSSYENVLKRIEGLKSNIGFYGIISRVYYLFKKTDFEILLRMGYQ